MNKRKKSGTGLCCIGFSAVNPACGRKERRRESRGRKAWRRKRRRRRPCWKITRVVKILYPSRGIPVARLQIHLFLPSGFIPFWSHLDSFKDLKIRFPPPSLPPSLVPEPERCRIKDELETLLVLYSTLLYCLRHASSPFAFLLFCTFPINSSLHRSEFLKPVPRSPRII